jgi:hypothetical protein
MRDDSNDQNWFDYKSNVDREEISSFSELLSSWSLLVNHSPAKPMLTLEVTEGVIDWKW